jgi:aminoglycoside phosphotransferase family enzyme/predicted kinase
MDGTGREVDGMELTRLMAALSDPASYPGSLGIEAVEVRQSHISVVFLAGAYAYKVKKPLKLAFLDYSTLERRRHFCAEEVRLNRRLARPAYLGVVPITADATGIRMEGRGEVVEWALKMVRLPDAASLRERLRRGELGVALIETLARRLAEFHARAEDGPAIAAYGRYEVVAGNARENFDEAAPHVGTTLSRAVFERLRALTDSALAEHRPTIEARAVRSVPRDGHGDLRLDHVYFFADREPPADLLIIDCIEFNERFRCADPVAEIAFPVMDLHRHGRRDLARAFASAYFQAAGDAEGRALLPLYTAYRAAVRGKVEGIEHLEPEVPEAERVAALVRARSCWLLALGELEKPSRRPCLVLVGGLPGTGKTTMARGLAEGAGFSVIRSDLVRKELAGLDADQDADSPFEVGIYTPARTERTYAECLRRAEALLFEGRRVLVDASFRTEASRRLFLELGSRWGVPALLLLCQADPSLVRQRLEGRTDDASDANWTIYLHAAERWEEPAEPTRAATRPIVTDQGEQAARSRALEALRGADLLE